MLPSLSDPLTVAIGCRWIAGTGLVGAGDSTFGTGNVDGSKVAPLVDICAALHTPKGAAHVLRKRMAKLTLDSVRDLLTFTDYLLLVVIDLVDAEPELLEALALGRVAC